MITKEEIKNYFFVGSILIGSVIFIEDRYAKQEQIKQQDIQIDKQNEQLKKQDIQISKQETLIDRQHSQLLYIINTLSEENRKSIHQMIQLEESLKP